jgi:glycosyltransferase involved in cell wall biosynthesis
MRWLLNFSASPTGGGRRRLEETAKWFEKHGGATFLVHTDVSMSVSQGADRNRFIRISQSKLERLLADGRYLPSIISELGRPDVYFSYGIPVFYAAGRVNWFHVSNSLTLTRKRHRMPLRRYLELQLLGRRTILSLKNTQIASAESEFALGLLKKRAGSASRVRRYVVLNNGCEDTLFRATGAIEQATGCYAMTIGTSPYKRLDAALAVFQALQARHPDLRTLKIVGDKKQIPKLVANDSRVQALGADLENEALYQLLRGAEYYISSSGIENSSTAASEGLLLSKRTVLSDIPSHREAIKGLAQPELEVPGQGKFIEVAGAGVHGPIRPPSWSDVLEAMHEVATDVAHGDSTS